MFDVPFLYGQPWPANEDDSGHKVVVISRKLNEQLFGGANSVGRTINLDDQLFGIVGVLDDWQPTPRFYQVEVGAFDDVEDVFAPISIGIEGAHDISGNVNCWAPMDGEGMEAFLRSECIWIQFWAELETTEQSAQYKEFLDNYVREQKQLGRFPRPLNTFISDVMAWMDVMGVVSNDNRVLMRLSFLFLIVCVLNTVSLLMAKFLGKGPEIALRRAMGASKGAIFLQSLFEVTVIGVLGGIAGVGMAWLGLGLIGNLYQGYQHLVNLNGSLLLIAIVLAIASSLAAGLYPVWRTTRLSPAGLLKTQ
jgi:putative ABC transport system permease protein